MVIICFITSYDAHLSHCTYTIVACSVFNIVTILGFYQKAEFTKPEFTCSKLTIKTIEEGLKYFQN